MLVFPSAFLLSHMNFITVPQLQQTKDGIALYQRKNIHRKVKHLAQHDTTGKG